jgi:hypothetical protein
VQTTEKNIKEIIFIYVNLKVSTDNLKKKSNCFWFVKKNTEKYYLYQKIFSHVYIDYFCQLPTANITGFTIRPTTPKSNF